MSDIMCRVHTFTHTDVQMLVANTFAHMLLGVPCTSRWYAFSVQIAENLPNCPQLGDVETYNNSGMQRRNQWCKQLRKVAIRATRMMQLPQKPTIVEGGTNSPCMFETKLAQWILPHEPQIDHYFDAQNLLWRFPKEHSNALCIRKSYMYSGPSRPHQTASIK